MRNIISAREAIEKTGKVLGRKARYVTKDGNGDIWGWAESPILGDCWWYFLWGNCGTYLPNTTIKEFMNVPWEKCCLRLDDLEERGITVNVSTSIWENSCGEQQTPLDALQEKVEGLKNKLEAKECELREYKQAELTEKFEKRHISASKDRQHQTELDELKDKYEELAGKYSIQSTLFKELKKKLEQLHLKLKLYDD